LRTDLGITSAASAYYNLITHVHIPINIYVLLLFVLFLVLILFILVVVRFLIFRFLDFLL
jgi:hypothetical protein